VPDLSEAGTGSATRLAAHTMNSRCLAIAVTPFLTALAACGGLNDIVDRWPTFTVAGKVTTATGAPVVGADVRVITWWSPRTCSDSIAFTLGSDTTDRGGSYQTRLGFLTSTFRGCVRVETGTVRRDTLVSDVRPDTRIGVNLQTP